MRFGRWSLLLALAACGPTVASGPSIVSPSPSSPSSSSPSSSSSSSSSPSSSSSSSLSCSDARPLVLHFYDVGQALSALVDLPDGRHILVDTGDSKSRAGCGEVCTTSSRHLDEMLERDLHGAPLDLVWITHQHSDHVGGAPDLLSRFPTRAYVDNGRDLQRPEIKAAHSAAIKAGAHILAIDPEHPTASEIAPNEGPLKLTAIVPRAWPSRCKSDQNDCSIMLRIDYCASSILFTGDAETDLEKITDPRGPVTLLQVGHHGSNTSSSEAFLERVRPQVAVISSGKPREGLNTGYCHPRASTVRRLTHHIDAARASTVAPAESAATPLMAYDRDDRCDDHDETAWVPVRTSAAVYSTARDGDVVLVTKGDGTFIRQSNLAH